MKKAITKAICILLLINIFIPVLNATAAEEFHWYCKRNKEHKQPTLDTNMRFIEDVGGYYVDKKHGDDCEEKVIYLTFDLGYENGNVEKIMDVMKAEDVKGAFFVLGNVIERDPELIKRMSDEGHLVCNHTTTHKNLVGASKEKFTEELTTLEKMYKDLTGKDLSKYYRPPEGTFDKTMLEYASELGYRTVFWSFAYADWDNNKQMSEEAALDKILSNIHNGEIMLLHPTSQTNAKIMERLIKELKSQGYRFGTLDELTSNAQM